MRALLLLTLLAAPALADGPGWRHLRGPRYDGTSVEEGLGLKWPSSGPPIWWRRKIGQGFSGCVTSGLRVYSQAQDAAGQYVLCLELSTGRTLWKVRYGMAWRSKWPGPYATPTVKGGKVYFAGCYGRVGCLTADSGSWVWSRQLDKHWDMRGTDFGYGCTPLVEDERCYLQVGARGASVVALDAQTGKTVWQTGDDPASYAPPYLITVEGKQQLISLLQRALVAHDPKTGRELWRHAWGDGGYDERSSMPVFSSPYLFVSAPFRAGARVLRIGHESAETLWSSDVLSADVTSPVIVADHVYGFDVLDPQAGQQKATRGRFKCVDLKTGRECWAAETGLASVIAVRNVLMLWTENGELIAVEATPEKYRERARAKLADGARCWTAPIYDRGCLILRAENELICVDLGANRGRLETTQRRAQVGTDVLVARWINDAAVVPGWLNFAIWIVLSLLLVGVSTVVARILNPRRQLSGACLGMVCLAPIALPIGGIIGLGFTFTWPLALVGALGFALVRGHRARRSEGSTGDARRALFGFLVVAACYLVACRGWGILIGWTFLPGLLLAAPLLYMCARQRKLGWRRWLLAATATTYLGAGAVVYFTPPLG